MKLHTRDDVRRAARGNPNARFWTQRDGPVKIVTLREAEEYFRGMSPKTVKALGRWFELVEDDRQSCQI